MNSKQRRRNRQTAEKLARHVKSITPCPECGQPSGGGHWVVTRQATLEDIINASNTKVPLNPDDFGYWTCDKFYGPDGRRLEQFVNPAHTSTAGALVAAIQGEILRVFETGETGDGSARAN